MRLKLERWRKSQFFQVGDAAAQLSALLLEIGQVNEIRARRKLARKLANIASSVAYCDTQDAGLISLAIDGLLIARRSGGEIEISGKSLAALYQRRLGISGCEEIGVLRKSTGRLSVDGALVVAYSLPIDEPDMFSHRSHLMQSLAAGHVFPVELGADMVLHVTMLYVDAPEPLPPAQYFQKLRGVTATGLLRCADQIRIEAFGGGPEAVSLAIPETYLKVCAYELRGKCPHLILVCCRGSADTPPLPGVQRLFSAF